MAQEVMIYHSGMQGAPSATMNVAGGLIAILDACLVDGFNVNAISTLTRTGTVATATTSGTNGYAVGDWVDVSGAVETPYNGRVKVAGKPAVNQFTYDVAGAPATPATGTITSKYGAAGWTKPYAGTNTAVYTTGAGSLGHSLQVEDTNPYADSYATARTRIIKDVSGIPDAGSQLGEQCRNQKANGGWVLVADHKTCYLVVAAQYTFCFGELASFNAGDVHHFFQTRGWNASDTAYYNGTQFGKTGTYFPGVAPGYIGNDTARSVTVLRAASQIGASVMAWPRGGLENSYDGGSGVNGVSFHQTVTVPNYSDNTLPMTPMFVVNLDGSIVDLRGVVRGVYWPVGQMAAGGFVNNIVRLDDVTIGGTLHSVAVCRMGPNSGSLRVAFDLGPTWG